MDELVALEAPLRRLHAAQRALLPPAKASMEAAQDLAEQYRGAADPTERLDVEQRAAARLTLVGRQWLALLPEYAAGVAEFDIALRALVSRVAAGSLDPGDQAEAAEALDGLLGFITQSRNLGSLSTSAQSVLSVVADAPDLRSSLDALLAAVGQIDDTRRVMGEWERLITDLPAH
jgi:hypothetical protein